jgi:hypothetical protein
MSATRYVTVRLTENEAVNVLHAAGYAVELPTALDVFGEGKRDQVADKASYRATLRAMEKIGTALYRAEKGTAR